MLVGAIKTGGDSLKRIIHLGLCDIEKWGESTAKIPYRMH